MRWLIVFLTGLFIGIWIGKLSGGKYTEKVTIEVDTVTVRDTLIDTVVKVVNEYIVRRDTVEVWHPSDTVWIYAEIPITQATYQGENYKAIIEGFRSKLLSIEVYPETKTIYQRETITHLKRQRFSVGIQAGYGVTNSSMYPYVGLGLQYNILSW